jgi:hypothetical protein
MDYFPIRLVVEGNADNRIETLVAHGATILVLKIPYAMMERVEARVSEWYGQMLDTIAGRGGLGAPEVVALLEGLPMPPQGTSTNQIVLNDAHRKLAALVFKFEAAQDGRRTGEPVPAFAASES